MKKIIRILMIILPAIFCSAGFYLRPFPQNAGRTASASSPGNLIINELLPNPAGADEAGEWVEIKNTGNLPENLQDWQLAGSQLPEIPINPEEIVVLARNPQAVKAKYSGLTNQIIAAVFVLVNSGDTIDLVNNQTGKKNTFNYGQSEEGRSFELLRGDCLLISLHPSADSLGKENSTCADFLQPSMTPAILPVPVTLTVTPTAISADAVKKQSKSSEVAGEQQKILLPTLAIPRIYRLPE